MKKLNNFLREWGIIVQIALIIMWVLWALQLGGLLKEGFYEQLEYQRTRDAKTEERVVRELYVLAEEFFEEAKTLGKNYTPKKYYEHLRALYTKSAEANYKIGGNYDYQALPTYPTRSKMMPGAQHTTEIHYLLSKNLQARTVSKEEMDIEVEKFATWEGNPYSRDKEMDFITPTEFKSWTLSLYLRTMLLLVISYITKMAYRKGILETILAEKLKFVLAIVFWPFLFSKYPYNVIREIRVEAELRRLGKLFRKLSPKELTLVREITNSSNYKQWISQTRTYNRGLVLALTITIIINLLPSTAKAQSTTSELTIISMSSCQQVENSVGETPNDSMPAIIEEPPPTEPPEIIATIEKTETPIRTREPETTKHIPVISLLLKVLKRTATVIAKGMYNAYYNYNYLKLRISFN